MTTPSRSNSSDSRVSLLGRLQYLWQLTTMNAKREPTKAHEVIEEIEPVVRDFEALTGKSAEDCRVLEIGFGARPFRAFALQAFFKDVVSVDLDTPIMSAADFFPALRTNGLTRATKGVVRAVFFDRNQWPIFHRGMAETYPEYHKSKSNLVIADAASDDFWSAHRGPYDLIISFDVFEHIVEPDLVKLVENIRANLSDGGICITRPCIFTGITGGHDPEWYGFRVESNSNETAWQHLWDPKFAVDTFLNRLSRRDMRHIFEAAGFEVVRDIELLPDLGRKHITPEIRRKCGDLDDYELFSNSVEFVLR